MKKENEIGIINLNNEGYIYGHYKELVSWWYSWTNFSHMLQRCKTCEHLSLE